jgi:hypothetical protein
MVTSTEAIKLYNGDGGTTRFPITLEHTGEDDIKVEKILIETGEYTELVLDTDWVYTVDGEAVYCDLTVALPATYKLMLSLDIPGTQPVHFVEGQPYVPNVLEKSLDRFALRDNQILSKLGGAITAPLEEGAEDMRLPTVESRAMKFLYFDEEGKPSVDPNVTAKPTTDYAEAFLLKETAKDAKSYLETAKNNVNAVSADYTVLDDDDYEVIEATGGAGGITITLPTLADNAGRILKIIKVDADPGLIDIDGEGAETINGEAVQQLTSQYAAISLIAGTTEWKVLNAGQKSSLTVEAKTADYTITDTDEIDIIEMTTGADDKTVTLPTLADNLGRSITIRKADNGDGVVVVDGEGSETINGELTQNIANQYKSITVYAGASEWGISVIDSSSADGGAVGDVKYTLDEEEKNGWKNAKYQAKSQSTYAELFSLIGHGYAKTAADAAAAEAAGTFHFPDGQFLFARAGQSWPITDASINITTDRITLTAHGLATDGSQDGRPIKLMRVPGQTPTMPVGSGYTEYDQNYIRVIDADTIELYASEAEAINTASTTGRVNWSSAGSGTFKLTTNGCYQSDAMQGHYHNLSIEGSSTANGTSTNTFTRALSTTASAPSVTSPTDDGLNGTPRTTNETRPSYVSLNMQIKAIGSSVSTGEAYDLLAFDTGWVANSTWVNASIPVTHNLGAHLSDLKYTLLISPDGLEENAYVIESGSYANGTNVRSYGHTSYEVDTTRFNIQTGNNGLLAMEEVTGNPLTIAAQAYYYKVVVYKPSLFAVTKTSPLVTVTTSQTVSIETVEKTIVVPSSVTTSLDITLSAGAGIDETHGIWIKNKSDEIQHVLYSTQTFWVSPGQKVKFYLDGTTLVWASGGWERTFTDLSATTNITLETALNKPVVPNTTYRAIIFIAGAYFHAIMRTDTTSDVQVRDFVDGTSWASWEYTPTRQFQVNAAGWNIKYIDIWHDPA